MYYTYVLLCTDENGKNKLYIGSTEDLKQRFLHHKSKTVETTKKFAKLELIYYEASLNKMDARKRELQLKTGFGRGYLKRRLEYYMKSRV